MAGNKYLKQANGVITEEAAVQTSAGAGDAGKIVSLDETGRLNENMMPIGIAPEADGIECSENLSAGDFVNIYSSSGVKCRRADASTSGKQADGFVLAAVTSGETVVVYRVSQTNNQVTGMTPGAKQYLSDSTPGGITELVPSGTGKTIQLLGIAKSATELIFAPNDPIVLA